MTPAARVQSATEILDSIIAAAKAKGAPADRILAEWFRFHRFAGSKDRRAVRELVYRAIRACGPLPETGRAAMLRLAKLDPSIVPLFDGSNYGPAAISEQEAAAKEGIAPPWLEAELAQSDISGEEAAALLDRAPLDIRVNTLKASRDSLQFPVDGEMLAAPNGIRLPAGTAVEQWDEFRDGLIEVQDCGSQLVGEAAAVRPGETVVDLCAGAGGKTLALAAAMQNQGTLIAADTDRGRLSRLPARAAKAGALVSETILLDTGREMEVLGAWQGKADAVLIDAPCSGTGTWRRNPEARWRLDEGELQRLADLQRRLLDLAAGLTRPGGRIIYVTCSLLDREGAGQVDAFLERNQGWHAEVPQLPLGRERGQGTRLTPYHDGTDGFFVARLCKA